MKPLRISKKQIRKIDFPKSDVLADIQKKKNRKQALQSAANRKKDDESAVKIVFESKRRGPLSIQSDVLVAHKDYVMLSGGHVLPMSSIRKVSL